MLFMVGGPPAGPSNVQPIPFVASGMSFFGPISSPYTWGVQLQHVAIISGCC